MAQAKTKLGPIPDEAFENDTSGAGTAAPELSPEDRKKFEDKTQEILAEARRIKSGKD